MSPFSKQKTIEANGFYGRKSPCLSHSSNRGYWLNMLVVLLMRLSTATAECPGICRCPHYKTALCSGSLPENFADLLDSRLEDLTLEDTNVTELACDVLPDSIEKLVLLRNRNLSAISFDCAWMRTLKHLEIYGSKKNPYEIFPFTDQHNESLNISDYPILPKIQTLHLFGVRVTNRFQFLFQFFSIFEELQLNYGDIQALVNINMNHSRLRLLDLSYNPIKNISVEFFHSMKNLERLELDWNRLTNLRGAIFHPLINLTFLRMDGNIFTSFEDDTFSQLHNLRKLRLSQNQVKYFQSALTTNLTQLQELYLNDNKLTKLEENVFDSLINLTILNLTQNFLTDIHSKTFKNQKRLQKLYLGCNYLKRLEAATFENLPSLILLDLSGNLLMEISGMQFPQGAKLQKLLLQQNSLENVDPNTFRPLGELETLRLDGNNFTEVYLETFEYLDNLKNLNLSDCKRLECNCILEKLWELCQLRNITLDNGALCYVDSNYSSMRWSDLKTCPSDKSEFKYITITIVVSVLVLFTAIFAPLVKYFMQQARHNITTWSPQNNTNLDDSSKQFTRMSKEEDYELVSAGDTNLILEEQEEYIEPTVFKVILPTCKPTEVSRKTNAGEVSSPSQPVASSPPITVPTFRAPAAPPEDYYMNFSSVEQFQRQLKSRRV